MAQVKKIKAWAVTCASGEVHGDEDSVCVFLDRGQARDTLTTDRYDDGVKDADCGPHKVVALVPEREQAQERRK